MVSVVIRNKNQEVALEFLLYNLTSRYAEDIGEILVLDNLSRDSSKKITLKYNAEFHTISNFSYGGSANIGARLAKNPIVVIFSAHSYPVSPEFFKTICKKFQENTNLAGVRCLHNSNDYINYILGIDAKSDPNKSGLIFSGSAFSKKVWEEIPFNENVPTFEDKDWTKRAIKAGFDIEFAPVIFNYNIKRTKAQDFFRFTKDLLGNYQIWHHEESFKSIFAGLFFSTFQIFKNGMIDLFYNFKKFFYQIKFKLNKPNKFDY
jgi:glycosyltransferase involved in cell wall biosynthesis